jgi:micrococcal nuclease
MRMRAALGIVVVILPALGIVLALAGCLGVTTGLSTPDAATRTSTQAATSPVPSPTQPSVMPSSTPTPAPDRTPRPTTVPTLVLGISNTDALTPAKLVRVVDATTIEVVIDGKNYQVRYIGVEPLGDGAAAKAKNEQLVSGQALKLAKDVTDADGQGRLLRYVYARAYMVNAELARLGYARAAAVPPDTLNQELFRKMEQEAREAKRGLWANMGVATPDTKPGG